MFLIYLLIIFFAGLLAFLLTGFVRNLAIKKQILSVPRERDVHQKPIPRLGGVAIAGTIIVTLLVVNLFNPQLLNFTAESRFGFDRHLLGVIVGMIIITLIGVWDDLTDLKPRWQFLLQFLAASVIIASGIGIDYIRSPWGLIPLNQWHWPLFTIGNYSTSITLWSDLFTMVWLVIIMNVINWLDGLDGLATGISGIAAFMLFVLSLLIGDHTATTILALIVAGAAFGFLPWNWHPAKIFMGSSGSYGLGFVLAVLAIISGGKLATAILVLGLPVFDAIWVASKRIFAGRSPLSADRSHLHHRLIDSGLSVRKSVGLLYVIALIFGILALIDSDAQAKLVLILWVVAVLVILGALTILLEKRNGKK